MKTLTKKEKAAAEVAAIRAKFSTPMTCNTSADLRSREDERFPDAAMLARNLGLANSTLTYREASYFAMKIVMKNDAGRYDEAWALLEDALGCEGRGS